MPRRSIPTATERENLFGWPEAHTELIRHYTLSAADLAIIRQHRGAANRLGYAVQLCSTRFNTPTGALVLPPIKNEQLLQSLQEYLSNTSLTA